MVHKDIYAHVDEHADKLAIAVNEKRIRYTRLGATYNTAWRMELLLSERLVRLNTTGMIWFPFSNFSYRRHASTIYRSLRYCRKFGLKLNSVRCQIAGPVEAPRQVKIKYIKGI